MIVLFAFSRVLICIQVYSISYRNLRALAILASVREGRAALLFCYNSRLLSALTQFTVQTLGFESFFFLPLDPLESSRAGQRVRGALDVSRVAMM